MKRTVAITLLIVLTLLVGCVGVQAGKPGETADTDVFPSDESTATHNAECPYLSPYNTLTDCDGEYLYCVQSQHEGIAAGIYRRPLDGEAWEIVWENDESPFEIGVLYQTASNSDVRIDSITPYISSIALFEDYIYFTRYKDIYRTKTDGSELTELGAGEGVPGDIFGGLRVVNGTLFMDGGAEQYAAYDLSKSIELNSSEVCDYFSDAQGDFCLILRRPWGECLPDCWSIIRQNGSQVLRCETKSDFKSDSPDSYLIDCALQRIYTFRVTESPNDPANEMMTVYDFTGNALAAKELEETDCQNAAPHGSVTWRNTADSWIYGHIERRYLVAYDLSTDASYVLDLATQPLHCDEAIDVAFGIVYFRTVDNIAHSWRPTLGSVVLVADD